MLIAIPGDLGTSFRNLNLPPLLLNSLNGLVKAQETLNFFVKLVWFENNILNQMHNFMCKYTKFHDKKLNLLNMGWYVSLYIHCWITIDMNIYLGDTHLDKHDKLTWIGTWV